jgi:hypothetical protein
MHEPGGIGSFLLQLLVLAVGVTLIATSGYWSRPLLVVASGVFFVNIFWVTLILGHDLRIWSFVRNTAAGNIFMLAVILANLLFIAVTAFG